MTLPLKPPIKPQLAKPQDELPEGEGWCYEPKLDGFRTIVFVDGDSHMLQSRNGRPMDRYFPELRFPPGRYVLDGELIIPDGEAEDFEALQNRIHPAASRVQMLAEQTPARFVAFDLLGAGGKSTMDLPQSERRMRLERLLGSARPPLHLTPITRDRAEAERWLAQFEGAGLDGVVAKLESAPYQPGKRVMLKIKHVRSADCVVGGFRWYKDRTDAVGSLLLGLYDDAGTLHHVGVTSSFTMAMRQQLLQELAPLRDDALASHPWRDWSGAEVGDAQRMPGAQSRWSGGKDLSWQPLRPERVCEVKYDHLQGRRFRHATTFMRWRTDKAPQECRYNQLDVTTPYELARVFGA